MAFINEFQEKVERAVVAGILSQDDSTNADWVGSRFITWTPNRDSEGYIINYDVAVAIKTNKTAWDGNTIDSSISLYQPNRYTIRLDRIFVYGRVAISDIEARQYLENAGKDLNSKVSEMIGRQGVEDRGYEHRTEVFGIAKARGALTNLKTRVDEILAGTTEPDVLSQELGAIIAGLVSERNDTNFGKLYSDTIGRMTIQLIDIINNSIKPNNRMAQITYTYGGKSIQAWSYKGIVIIPDTLINQVAGVGNYAFYFMDKGAVFSPLTIQRIIFADLKNYDSAKEGTITTGVNAWGSGSAGGLSIYGGYYALDDTGITDPTIPYLPLAISNDTKTALKSIGKVSTTSTKKVSERKKVDNVADAEKTEVKNTESDESV